VNKLFLVELGLPNLFRVLSRELVEKSESRCRVVVEPPLLLFLMELRLLLLMLLGLLRVLGLNLVAKRGLSVVVVVIAELDLKVFLNLVRVRNFGAEVVLLSNLDEARVRDLGLVILVEVDFSGTSEGACLLKAVWCLEEGEEGLLTELLSFASGLGRWL